MQLTQKFSDRNTPPELKSNPRLTQFLVRYQYQLTLAFLAAFTLILFGRTLGYSLYWDDYHNVRPWGFYEVLGTFAGPFDPLGLEPPYFRPLAVVTFAIDWNLWGYNAWGYHLTNTLFHFLSAALLYTLLRRVKLGWGAAFGGALFFLAIPLNAATVEYISERSDALVAIFSLIGLLCLDNFRQSNKIYWLLGLNLSLVLTLCSKEVGSGLVFLILFYWPLCNWLNAPILDKKTKLIDFWRQWWSELKYTIQSVLKRGQRAQLLQVCLPPILILGVYLIYRSRVLPIQGLGGSYNPGVSPAAGLVKAIYATVKGVPWEVPAWSFPLLVILVGIALLLKPRSYAWRYIFFGVGWIILTCVPLAPLGGIEPRLVYFPAIGLAIVGAALLAMFLEAFIFVRANPKRIFLTGLVVSGAIGLLFIGTTLFLEIQAQDQFAPYSAKMLYRDEEVYKNPDRYPPHALQVIELKLRQAGRIP